MANDPDNPPNEEPKPGQDKPGGKDAKPASGGGSIIDAAILNFDIARQYIDESLYPSEHKLIRFHHGVALMTERRKDAARLSLAAQCFNDALSWRAQATVRDEPEEEALQRILCEANYNLAVVRQLQDDPKEALSRYHDAKSIAAACNFVGAGILARFGWISLSMDMHPGLSFASDRTAAQEVYDEIAVLESLVATAKDAPVQEPPALPTGSPPEPRVVSWVRQVWKRGPQTPPPPGEPPKQSEQSTPPNQILKRILSKLEEFRDQLGPPPPA